jgi:hypothetical protein
VDPARVVNLIARRPDVSLHPPSSLKLDLQQTVVAPRVEDRQRARARQQPREFGHQTHSSSGSWWTQRAKTGDVSAGFNKENLTRPVAEDPRAEDGVFDRILGLLTELSDLA